MDEHSPRHPEREAVPPVKARQGTGPSSLATVLIVSTVVAAVGTALLTYIMT